MLRRHILWAVFLGVAVAGISVLLVRGGRPHGGSPVTKEAPALRLADDDGGQFDLARQRGQVVLVTFGYTHCPDVCPTMLGDIDAAVERLGDEASRVRTVFVTIDPARDTPRLLRDYLGNFTAGKAGQPIGLTDAAPRIAAAERAWGVSVRSADHGAFFDHTAMVAAIGPDGRLRLRYSFSQLQDSGAVARDLSRLIAGG